MMKLSGKSVLSLSIFAVILILIGSFSLWLNNNIFNRENFSKITVGVIRTQRVREAIGAETVDQIFAGSPILKQVVGDTVQSAIGGLIGSQALRPVLTQVANEANILITTRNPQAVKFDMSGIRDFIKPVASALDSRAGKSISKKDIPKEIVLINKGDFPSIYSWGVVMLWLGPILGLIGLGIIVGLIWRAGTERRDSILKTIGATTAIASVIFIILVEIAKAPILASITSSNVRTITESLYSAFAGRLMAQTWILFVAGLVLLGVGWLLPSIRKLPAAEKVRNLRVAS